MQMVRILREAERATESTVAKKHVLDNALRVIAVWMDHYDLARPHQALDYLTPAEYRAKLAA